jgi:biopolymer transport protein ExbB/TolQ
MQAGGPFMWLLSLIFLVILYLSVRKGQSVFFKKEAVSVKFETGLNAILFWGVLSIVIGFLAHFMGLYQALLAISRATDVSPAVIAQGYAQSLLTILFGMTIFIVSAVFWFLLRWRYKKIS